MIRKSDYENYDYREFWEDGSRLYEDSSERLAIKKLFRSVDKQGRTFIDLGCGYARLFKEYMDFRNIILVDYSLKNLKNARAAIHGFLGADNEKLKNVFFVSADVKHLPFRNGMIDSALTVRVIHHIPDPEVFFKEVGRILSNDSLFVLEFANKRNLKNILRFFTGRMRRSPFSTEAFHVGETILNYHPKHIKTLLLKNGFQVNKQISVSNLRLGFLKNHLKLNVLVFFENLLQNMFSWMGTGPSIFLKTACCDQDKGKTLNSGQDIMAQEKDDVLLPEDIFICPACKSDVLDYSQNGRIICNSCGKVYRIRDGIYDFKP